MKTPYACLSQAHTAAKASMLAGHTLPGQVMCSSACPQSVQALHHARYDPRLGCLAAIRAAHASNEGTGMGTASYPLQAAQRCAVDSTLASHVR